MRSAWTGAVHAVVHVLVKGGVELVDILAHRLGAEVRRALGEPIENALDHAHQVVVGAADEASALCIAHDGCCDAPPVVRIGRAVSLTEELSNRQPGWRTGRAIELVIHIVRSEHRMTVVNELIEAFQRGCSTTSRRWTRMSAWLSAACPPSRRSPHGTAWLRFRRGLWCRSVSPADRCVVLSRVDAG